MATTCINPPNLQNKPNFRLPDDTFAVADGDTAVVLIPTGLVTLSIFIDGVIQIDLSPSAIATIQGDDLEYDEGMWATNVNSSNLPFYTVVGRVRAARFVNSSGGPINVGILG